MHLDPLLCAMADKHAVLGTRRGLLVAISGIDAAGKGFIAAQIAKELQARELRVALINADGWLDLPTIRFNPANPAAQFYEHALRLEEMFAQLIDPLTRNRSGP